VKHLVQLHEGRVWAKSRAGEGTQIILTLPCSKS
jgi:signal transduction histidine kinase